MKKSIKGHGVQAKIQALPNIPDSPAFRDWLISALDALDLRAGTVSRQAGVPPNAVKKFVDGVNREIHLSSAARVADFVVRKSIEAGVTLPPCPVLTVSS